MAFASTVHAQSCSASTEKSTKLSIHENLYQPVPAHLKLEKVVVIHRHGDRTPIERGCGPNFPERKSMSGKWASTLPSLKTIERIERVGRIVYQSVSEKQFVEMTEAYSGWDQKDIPYGQLTELGAQQLIRLGEKMRHRYGGYVLPLNVEEAEKHVYCRSTFICRTVHSIRSFLVGLYNIEAAESEPTTPSSSNDEAKLTLAARKYHFPTIHTRPKLEETLYPQVDGRCSVILDRRVKIEPLRHLSFYDEISTKMRRIFGYTETNLPWINMQEVLTCHSTYNLLHHFPEVDVNDIDQISDILAGIWGILYRDPEMARLGLGRFVAELMADIEEIPHDHHHQVKQKFNHPVDDVAPTKNKKFLVYSAHDSTLIPLLCMLRLFDDKWPIYAASIVIEIARDNDEGRYVRVLYNDRAYSYSRVNKESGHEEKVEWIDYDTFKSLLSQYQISHDEYKQICSRSSPSSSPPSSPVASNVAPTFKNNR